METFLVIHREGSFAAAARRLGVSEAAIGKQMAALERAVGGPLFERRTGAAVRLNARGRLLLDRAPELVDKAQELDRMLRPESTQSAIVRVGVDDVQLGDVFYPNIGGFYRAYPDLQIEFVASEPSLDSVPTMADRRLDLAYLTLLEPAATSSGQALAHTRGGLYISPRSYAAQNWGNRSRRPLPVILPPEGSGLERSMLISLKRAGISNYRVTARVEHGDAMRALAIEGIGACIIAPSRVVRFVQSGQLVRIVESVSEEVGRYVFRGPLAPHPRIDTVENYLSALVRKAVW